MGTMATSMQRSYAEIDHWRKYQRFLPERMRLTAGRLGDRDLIKDALSFAAFASSTNP
jgi:hypothetical protein